jgi:Tol biopolymer transport system component
MSLSAGTKLGPYVIVAPLGAGGMGEVYRAHDAKLSRDVAIKVLPAHLSGDPVSLERLQREARALASNSHPNILSVFDLGTSDGLTYIVMELLDGHTLRTLLGDGPLPIRKAVDYAIQIAQGLGAAHDRGITHRDLKPENLFVTRDGHVKILDFGLARQHAALSTDETTALAQGTEPGTVLGTVGYMSPEQVQGKPADARSDIFSFGAVLYEMLSGRRAFKGESAADTMHAILREDPPDLDQSARSLPPALGRIVAHCLEKSPDQRFQSARDVAFDLESLSTLSSSRRSDAGPPVRSANRRRVATYGALVVAGALAGALVAAMLLKGTPIESPTYRRVTFDRGAVTAARFAPDGQTIVYSAGWRGQPNEIYTARLDSRESRPLGLGHALLQAVSSSSELAIGLETDDPFRGATLGRVPLAGGAARASVENVSFSDWLPSGADLAAVRVTVTEQRVEFPIGHVVYRTNDSGISHLRVSPAGDWVAFAEHPVATAFGGGRLVALDRAGTRKLLSKPWTDIYGVAWRPDGREVWFTAADGTDYKALHAATLDGGERLVTRMLGQVDLQDISRDGRVLVSQNDFRSEMIARTSGASADRTLTWLGLSQVADLSADGSRILFNELQPGGGVGRFVYLRSTDGSPAIRLGEGQALALSPDGKWALASVSSSTRLLALPTGAGEPRDLTRNGFDYSRLATASWFPDSRHVLYSAVQNQGPLRLFVQDIDGGEPRVVVSSASEMATALEQSVAVAGTTVSPDGRHFFTQQVGGPPAIYSVDGGDAAPIKGLEAGAQPIGWSQDGRSLICRRDVGLASEVSVLEIATGRRALLWRLAMADPAGASRLGPIVVTADGKSYAYSYYRNISDLYLVDGLK